MMATESQSSNPFAGQWRAVSMEQWDAAFISGGQVRIEFDDHGRGLIQFGCVYGEINCWLTTRNGEPAMEWRWEGSGEIIGGNSPGWAILKGDELHGVISLFGASASFVAERELLRRAPRKRKE